MALNGYNNLFTGQGLPATAWTPAGLRAGSGLNRYTLGLPGLLADHAQAAQPTPPSQAQQYAPVALPSMASLLAKYKAAQQAAAAPAPSASAAPMNPADSGGPGDGIGEADDGISSSVSPGGFGLSPSQGASTGMSVAGPIGAAIGFGLGSISQGMDAAQAETAAAAAGIASGMDGGIGADGLGGSVGGFGGGMGLGGMSSAAGSMGLGTGMGNEGGFGFGGLSGMSEGIGESEGSGEGGESGEGGGWAKGGVVTKDRLSGPDPAGPDEGYGALKSGEFVINADAARAIGYDKLHALNKLHKAKKGLL